MYDSNVVLIDPVAIGFIYRVLFCKPYTQVWQRTHKVCDAVAHPNVFSHFLVRPLCLFSKHLFLNPQEIRHV